MTYWEKRALLREARSAKKANDLIDQLVSLYDKAEKEIVEDIRKIIKNYARSGGMDTKQAIKYLTEIDKTQDINELLKQMASMTDGEQKQELLRRINAPAYRARLDRLQVLQDKIDIKLTQLAAQEVRLNTIAFGDELVDAYYRACFDMQQQAGYMNVVERLENGITLSITSGSILPTEAFEAALDYNWTSRSYSDSVWENTHELAKEAKEIVQRGLLTGRSVPRMTAELEQRFRTAKHKAARVVRTEMNHFHNQGDLVAYEKMGVERYRYLATLDAVTCERCGALDNQVFSVSDAEPGKNFPPLHPNDRCTTTPALDDAVLAEMKRRARDPKTGKTYLVPANMSYTEWDAEQDKLYGAGTVDAARKMRYNTSADKKQFERYKALLGDEVPKTFADFQKLKYDDPVAYNDLCEKYAYKGRVSEATAADYAVYRAVKNTGIYGTVRVPPQSIDTSVLTLDTAHITDRGHGVTLEEAISYIKNASFTLKRTLQDGKEFINYYSSDGAAYVNIGENTIRTAFKRAEYDSKVTAAMEAAENAR